MQLRGLYVVSIAPSMLGADFGEMRKAAEMVASHSSYLHMDVMDGHFTKSYDVGSDLLNLSQRNSSFRCSSNGYRPFQFHR